VKTKLVFLVLVVFLVCSCSLVKTRVSSISHHQINPQSSIYIFPGDKSIESQKFAKIIKLELRKKGFNNFTSFDKAQIVVAFSGAMLGSKTNVGTINTPV